MRAGRTRSEALIPLLERKRILDSAWILTLALQLVAFWVSSVLAVAGMGEASRAASLPGFAPHGWGLALSLVLYVAAADLGYRLRSAVQVTRAIYLSQLGGVLCLASLWTLSGGADHPVGLVWFLPPLLVSGMLHLRTLPFWSGALAFAAVWCAALLHPSAFSAALEQGSLLTAPGAPALWAMSLALPGVALLSGRVGNALRRVQQRAEEVAPGGGLFEALLDAASEPAVVVYADTFQMVQANDAFRRRTLLRSEELSGRSLFALLAFETRERLEHALARDSGEVRFQSLWIGPERVRVNLRFYHAEHDGVRYLHVAFADVSAQHYFVSAFDAIEDAVMVLGEEEDLLYANLAACNLFGELYLHKPMRDLLRSRRLLPRAGIERARSVQRVAIDGEPHHLQLSKAVLGLGGPACRVFTITPFDEQEREEDAAMRDERTGLYNRRNFENTMRAAVREVSSERPLALALWKLEDWKRSREEAGEEFADALLDRCVEVLDEEHRESDQLCRVEEDLFALLLPGTGPEDAERVVQRMLLALDRNPLRIGEAAHRVAMSVGVAGCREGESVAALVARADDALNAAQESDGLRVLSGEPAAE